MNDEKPVEFISADRVLERIKELEGEKTQYKIAAEATLTGYDMAILVLKQLLNKPAN